MFFNSFLLPFLLCLSSFLVTQVDITLGATDESLTFCDLAVFEDKMKKDSNQSGSELLPAEEKGRLLQLVDKVKILEGHFLKNSIPEKNRIAQNANAKERTIIVPAFEWAQSPDLIFINFKFSHRLSAPATLNVVEEKVNITNSVISFVMHNNKDKEFRFRLDLWKDIKVDEVSYSFGSVGRCTFTLPKKDSSVVWPRIYAAGAKKPANMHLWYAVHEKYEDKLEELKENSGKGKDEEKDKDSETKTTDSESQGDMKKEKKDKVDDKQEKQKEDDDTKKSKITDTSEIVKSREM